MTEQQTHDDHSLAQHDMQIPLSISVVVLELAKNRVQLRLVVHPVIG